jgi:hypothetical protein
MGDVTYGLMYGLMYSVRRGGDGSFYSRELLLLLNFESKDVSTEIEVSRMPFQNDWIPT